VYVIGLRTAVGVLDLVPDRGPLEQCNGRITGHAAPMEENLIAIFLNEKPNAFSSLYHFMLPG
jgi:hypothetical protein